MDEQQAFEDQDVAEPIDDFPQVDEVNLTKPSEDEAEPIEAVAEPHEDVDFVNTVEPPLDEAPYELPDDEEDVVTEEDDEVEVALARAGENAAAVANSASQSLKEGLEAVRNVRALSRQHADARAQLENLRRELDDAMEILDHRVEIERSFDQIYEQQTTEIQATRNAIDNATADMASLAAERDQLSARLTALRAENEEALRPYKNLLDTAKGRADDAAVALADVRRAVKAAETQASDATRKRDSRVSAANRAVDNAQERLRRVQTELDKLSGDPDAPITALPKMRDELVTERAHLDDAREEVEKVITETQQAVEEAQARLFSLKQTLESAERVAEDTKREASERREEYDRLYKQARAAEEEINNAIKERTASIAQLAKTREEAEKHLDALQIVLDEAIDIHETPEVTKQLRDRITAGQAELERQDREVKNLAQSVKHLRESTRGKRILFFAVIAAVVLVAILLIWFFATRSAR